TPPGLSKQPYPQSRIAPKRWSRYPPPPKAVAKRGRSLTMVRILAAQMLPALVVVIAVGNARADLRFPEAHANGGTVRSAAPVVHHFSFVNQGPETVEITGLQGSCGCLKPQVAKSTYQPGEQGTVDLEINTLSQAPGPHSWSVRVSYLAGKEPRE